MSDASQHPPPPRWDCHFHVFDSARYQLAPDCAYDPGDAPLSAFRATCNARGIRRGVLVHPSVYGADHSSFEDTLAAHNDWLRGVAVVYPDEALTPDAQIERWHALGARGTRINRLFPSAPRDVARVVDRVRPLGWHVQVLLDIVEDFDVVRQIVDRGLPVVIDHFGHHAADSLLGSPRFDDLLALLREGSAWVKLSAPYRLDPGAAPWGEVLRLADALLGANADRLVWGSDWPHPPNHKLPFDPPSEEAVTTSITDWLSDAALLERVMSTNPAALYGPL